MPIVTPIDTDRPVPTNATLQRDARAVEHAREDVAAELVDAEEVLASSARSGRPKSSSASVDCTFGRGRADELEDQRREDRRRGSAATMKRQRDQRDLVLAEAPPEQLQRRARGHRRLAGDDLSTPLSSACSRSLAPVPVLKFDQPPRGGSGSLIPRTDEQPTPCARTTDPRFGASATPRMPRQESNLLPRLGGACSIH